MKMEQIKEFQFIEVAQAKSVCLIIGMQTSIDSQTPIALYSVIVTMLHSQVSLLIESQRFSNYHTNRLNSILAELVRHDDCHSKCSLFVLNPLQIIFVTRDARQ